MKIEPRDYQKAIFQSIMEKGNMLVVLPTGLGKTLIAFMLIENKSKTGKCLLLAPTKPLVKQHHASYLDITGADPACAVIITGEIPKKSRANLYETQVVFSTPQTIKNDLVSGTLKDPKSFSLCVFDEAHRAMGNYAYTLVAERMKDSALLVGLTASPGGNRERIAKILSNLFIKNVEIRTKHESDVQPYVKRTDTKWLETHLTPDLQAIKKELDFLCSQLARKLAGMGFPAPIKSKKLFLQLRQKILNIKSNAKFPILITYFMLLNTLHMQELIETQGASALKNYITKLETKESKTAKSLLRKPEILKVKHILSTTSEEHPKLVLLINLLKQMKEKKTIVFAQYRDQVKLIESKLTGEGLQARVFLGKKEEYTKKQQEQTIADFREDKFKILVASSIGEEGLDIPAVDMVIFYEPIPSEIRSIQRRGRAGRFKEGEVYILMTKGTRDEYFYWASINREKRMKSILTSMQKEKAAKSSSEKPSLPGITIKTDKEGQSSLDSFF